MNQQIDIGIIGEFDPDLRYHVATNEALEHAGKALSVTVKPSWVSTQSLSSDTVETKLKAFHGLWCAPGDYKSMDGALLAIRFAREMSWPFIGT